MQLCCSLPFVLRNSLLSFKMKEYLADPSKFAAAAPAASAATEAPATPAGSAAEPAAKKEEPKEEESDDEDMGFGLFD